MTNLTKNNLTRTLAAGAATFGVLAGMGLASDPASALTLTFGTGGTSGTATLVAPTANPPFVFTSTDANGVVSMGTGQFDSEGGVDAVIIGLPVTFSLIGSPGSYTTPAVADFLSIQRADGKTVKVSLLGGSPASSFTSGANFMYSIPFIPAFFDEPAGETDISGYLTINASSNSSGAGISQTYQITFNKDIANNRVPEPSAILGILAVAGVGAFARRKS
ncbi:PEP-CTERM sorting domain-containing protein [Microcystis aeruginosa]|uniref:PEP-CTERM sorting domain-containing protein n=1 Tax=Microcystis aeruginosa TaxID=1126 RepID=UPI00232B8D0B|nr:PEP-CTERM sorting domain-containing protein [Microcystis aeruginosa]MDB9389839.1 PEP-CTERM sorting domain-containing protein [Microcystis aeruginosa CS-579]